MNAAEKKSLDMPARLLLWVDGVGGFLICLEPRLSVGQAGGGSTPDLAILADIARQHAMLERTEEGYIVEAIHKASLSGRVVERAFLRCGDRLTLGKACQVVFSQPVPLSASARLELVSGQRWLQPIQAVLLMAETLILGPAPQAHIVVKELQQPLILFRCRDGLAVRHRGTLIINGHTHRERGPLGPGSHVNTEAISFTLEAV